MATYVIMNILFIAAWSVALRLRVPRPWHVLALMIIVLVVLTAIFDSLIIGMDFVAYDESKILGWRIGLAPVEDFFYSFFAILLVPALWHRFQSSREEL